MDDLEYYENSNRETIKNVIITTVTNLFISIIIIIFRYVMVRTGPIKKRKGNLIILRRKIFLFKKKKKRVKRERERERERGRWVGGG